jgi:anti-anti-sigma regulatory factor
MNNAFFLLILPTRTLTIHLGSYQQCMGLSLRGSCLSEADAAHLLHTVQQLLERRPAHAWIDGQQLQALSPLGQQALLRAQASGQQAGTQLHWCGLSAALRRELEASGLAGQLLLQPAASYEGPGFLLPERLAVPGRQSVPLA